MDYSATFARHFARLVSLLMYDAANVDEQKVSLRALVTVNKNGSVALASREWELLANDQPIPGALTGVRDVASQMVEHSLREIQIGAASSAADLLGLARIIATRPTAGDPAAEVTQKLVALGAKSIAFVTTTPVRAPVESESAAPTAVVASDSEESVMDAPAAAAQEASSTRWPRAASRASLCAGTGSGSRARR